MSLLTVLGGALLGRLPCAASSMAVSASEGLAIVGKPFDRGKLNGAAETTERHERPTAIANLESIMKKIDDILNETDKRRRKKQVQ